MLITFCGLRLASYNSISDTKTGKLLRRSAGKNLNRHSFMLIVIPYLIYRQREEMVPGAN